MTSAKHGRRRQEENMQATTSPKEGDMPAPQVQGNFPFSQESTLAGYRCVGWPTYMHTYTYIHTYMHACMHTYIHTYRAINIYGLAAPVLLIT
jgi:hypothetical protein